MIDRRSKNEYTRSNEIFGVVKVSTGVLQLEKLSVATR